MYEHTETHKDAEPRSALSSAAVAAGVCMCVQREREHTETHKDAEPRSALSSAAVAAAKQGGDFEDGRA